MLIVSNGLTERPDEGFLNVANHLVKRLKAARSDVFVVSYERQSSCTDCYLKLNKLLLHPKLISLVRRHRDSVLYLPFPAKTLPTALRIFLLSLFAGKPIRVILVMKSEMGAWARRLLRWSKAHLVVFSKEAANFYSHIVSSDRVTYWKTGVDTERFVPVSAQRSRELKEAYGLDPDRPVILHVGHLKAGRNVGRLLELDPRYQVVLVSSTLTKEEQDPALKEQLESAPNVTLWGEYLPHIEEMYQLADLYFFPTLESGNCIDVPLSCLEAASCGVPVMTTPYGEMKELLGKPGFYPMEPEAIPFILEQEKGLSRQAVLPYDWNEAVRFFGS